MVTSAYIYIWKLLTVISILILNHILKHNKIYNILKHTKTPIICSHALQFSRICSFKIEKHLYPMYRLWFFNRVYPESLTGIKEKKDEENLQTTQEKVNNSHGTLQKPHITQNLSFKEVFLKNKFSYLL